MSAYNFRGVIVLSTMALFLTSMGCKGAKEKDRFKGIYEWAFSAPVSQVTNLEGDQEQSESLDRCWYWIRFDAVQRPALQPQVVLKDAAQPDVRKWLREKVSTGNGGYEKFRAGDLRLLDDRNLRCQFSDAVLEQHTGWQDPGDGPLTGYLRISRYLFFVPGTSTYFYVHAVEKTRVEHHPTLTEVPWFVRK